MPLGLALVIIYACPLVGLILPRIFPRKRFGNHLSFTFSAILLILCFSFVPLILYYTQSYPSEKSQTNTTLISTKNITSNKLSSENHTNHDNSNGDNDKLNFVGIEMYYLGVGMALLISLSDAAHKMIVGYLYGNKSTNSTLLTTYYAGYGGILVGLIASIFDANQRILSSKITNIPSLYWGLLFGLAILKLVTFLIINAAVKPIRPLALTLMKYRRKNCNKQ